LPCTDSISRRPQFPAPQMAVRSIGVPCLFDETR
jgi:hypothetical protein